MNNNPKLFDAVMLLALSTLTQQVCGQVQADHNHYEPRGSVLATTFGSGRSGRLRDDRTVTLRRLSASNPRSLELQLQHSGAAEGSRKKKSSGNKHRQRPLSGRKIDSEPPFLNTAEPRVEPEPSELNPDWQAAHTLVYYWQQYAGTLLCSKVPFQLLVLQTDTDPRLIVDEAQLGEHGCFCVAIRPTEAEGQAELYFNADAGQLDICLSTLEVNGKSVPLDQLEPLCVETPMQGYGLELSVALVEGFGGTPPHTMIRLDALQIKVQEAQRVKQKKDLDCGIYQYGGNQSKSGSQKEVHQHTQQTHLSTSSTSLIHCRVDSDSGNTGSGNNDEDPDPHHREDQPKDALDVDDPILAWLVNALTFLLASVDDDTLNELTDYLEAHLSLVGLCGNSTPTLNIALQRAFKYLNLKSLKWSVALEHLRQHPDFVQGFVNLLERRNQSILQGCLQKLSGSQVAKRATLVSKRISVSLPDLVAANIYPYCANPTTESVLCPLLQQTLPACAEWHSNKQAHQVFEEIGATFEEIPGDVRYLVWVSLMQTLGLPDSMEFPNFRVGAIERLNNFMSTQKGSQQALAQAIAVTLPMQGVNILVLRLNQLLLASKSTHKEPSLKLPSCHSMVDNPHYEPSIEKHDVLLLCKPFETDCIHQRSDLSTAQNSLYDNAIAYLRQQLSVIIMDDSQLESLIRLLQSSLYGLQGQDLDTAFNLIGLPSGRWLQALLHFRRSNEDLEFFLRNLSRQNRIQLNRVISLMGFSDFASPTIVQPLINHPGTVYETVPDLQPNTEPDNQYIDMAPQLQIIELEEEEYIKMTPSTTSK